MYVFMQAWIEAAETTTTFFWKALWAFMLGYAVSSAIQVFVTRERMRQTMGEAGPRSVALGTVFGFVSSSCSFAALATTRTLLQKGAGLIPALAFLLASTNLVIELGIVIAVFLTWQFVVGEYVGGLLLILFMWGIVRATYPKRLVSTARQRLKGQEEGHEEIPDWRKLIRSVDGWRRVARLYFMEWQMVWKDVTVGFTVAGIIAAFVPAAFFQRLFVGSGEEGALTFYEILAQTAVAPVAAFFTFIGSMGNIPLASLLFTHGVSFAGVMAFMFSDLVVFPVLRIQAMYYGWRMALYILGVFLIVLIGVAMVLHYAFDWLGLLPSQTIAAPASSQVRADQHTLWLNLLFVVMTLWFATLAKSDRDKSQSGHEHSHNHHHRQESENNLGQRTLFGLAIFSWLWIAGGMLAKFVTGV